MPQREVATERVGAEEPRGKGTRDSGRLARRPRGCSESPLACTPGVKVPVLTPARLQRLASPRRPGTGCGDRKGLCGP